MTEHINDLFVERGDCMEGTTQWLAHGREGCDFAAAEDVKKCTTALQLWG